MSSAIAFPTRGLAEAVLGERAADAVLLPPGAPTPVEVELRPTANQLLFVGDARLPAQGADRLLAAVDDARSGGADVGLIIVCRPGQEPPEPHPDWLRIVRAEGNEIVALLSSDKKVKPGDNVEFAVPMEKLHIFDPESEKTLAG